MTRVIDVGGVKIGGGNPISIQSMTTTNTADTGATVAQIKRLEEAGCQIVRVAVPDQEAAESISKIRREISIPLVCDIHFDYRLALECIRQGADKIRINPGNIGNRENTKKVALLAKQHGVPIRIGVNTGSINREILKRFGSATPEAMVESALEQAEILEDCGLSQIAVSLKASDVVKTVEAYRLMRQKSDYPLHIGVTEAGGEYAGLIKSSVGIGTLLMEGIGDTLRVSLTADPVREVQAAKEILKACGKRQGWVNLISCPTCGRCCYDMISIAKEVERRLASMEKDITVAVMGCVVNGPGEAKNADIGVAGGRDEAVLFRKGEVVRKIPFSSIVEELMKEIEAME